MIKNLLVTGEPGAGKTTLVEALIEPYRQLAGGIVTREIRTAGERKGFRLCSLDGRSQILAHVDFDRPHRVGKYGVDEEVMDLFAVPGLQSALERSRLIVIDEIARMELVSPSFRRVALQALSSDRVVLATVHAQSDPFSDILKDRSDVCLFKITQTSRESTQKILTQLLADLLTP
ncbi:AAA family ATPase [Candidatus Uhrbacteria bacterium]|nr:AAA family ATPase [Candidatus Uhrbacteria bacterium]